MSTIDSNQSESYWRSNIPSWINQHTDKFPLQIINIMRKLDNKEGTVHDNENNEWFNNDLQKIAEWCDGIKLWKIFSECDKNKLSQIIWNVTKIDKLIKFINDINNVDTLISLINGCNNTNNLVIIIEYIELPILINLIELVPYNVLLHILNSINKSEQIVIFCHKINEDSTSIIKKLEKPNISKREIDIIIWAKKSIFWL